MSRTSILVNAQTGIPVNNNGNQFNLIVGTNPITGESDYTSFFNNQITLEFFNKIITSSYIDPFTNETIISSVPDISSVVKTGLSGTVQFMAYPSINCPYPVDLSQDIVDISKDCIIQWTGITQTLNIVPSNIIGTNYINILIDLG